MQRQISFQRHSSVILRQRHFELDYPQYNYVYFTYVHANIHRQNLKGFLISECGMLHNFHPLHLNKNTFRCYTIFLILTFYFY